MARSPSPAPTHPKADAGYTTEAPRTGTGRAFGDHALRLTSALHDITVLGSPCLLGRDVSCTLQLSSTKGSRLHAAIYRFGQGYLLRDFGSRNGTQLNGQDARVVELRPGDVIRVGDDEFLVGTAAAPAPLYGPSCVTLFLDMENFTALAARLGESFVAQVGGALDELANLALRHGGCPVKSLGDGMLTAFGLWADSTDRKNACDAALDFAQDAASVLSAATSGEKSLRCRVGMAQGSVVVRDDNGLDILGDSVNVASRLEALNKLYGSHVMVAESVAAGISDPSRLRELDTVRVKGRDEPLVVFGLETDPRAGALYAQGLADYRAGRFQEAAIGFVGASKLGDAAARHMWERVQGLASFPPRGFDGVWTVEEK